MDAVVMPIALGLAAARPVSPLVSCIVPAFNEEGNIVEMLQALHRVLEVAAYRHELVVIDDGSTDATAERVVREAAGLPVVLVQLSRNFGKEVALTAGIDQAQGDVAVLIDSDFQHPPAMVLTLLDHWRHGYDMVYGVRSSRAGEGLLKRACTQAFYALLNRCVPVRIPANTQDFRVLDRCVLDALRQLPERNRFMKGLYNWVGFSQLPVVVPVAARRVGRSSFTLRRLFGLGVTGLTAFSNLPLRIWTVVGCLVSLCSIFYAVWEAVRTLLFGNPVSGWPTLTVAITFLGGVQLLSIGVLGEYIGRIFNEVKQRPNYLVRRVIHLAGTSR